jgi:hypothetical protein
MTGELYDIKSDMDRDGVILSYSGPINQDIIEGLSSVVKEKLKLENISMGTSLKIFAVFIEQIQNILYYSQDSLITEEGRLKSGITIIGRRNDHFFVISGNETNQFQKERLEGKLKKLSKMSRDELKEAYKSARRVESDEFSSGAGLGFLEMARKSSQPIEYEFRDIGEDRFFFSLNIII